MITVFRLPCTTQTHIYLFISPRTVFRAGCFFAAVKLAEQHITVDQMAIPILVIISKAVSCEEETLETTHLYRVQRSLEINGRFMERWPAAVILWVTC